MFEDLKTRLFIVLTTLFCGILSYFSQLFIPLFVLLICMICDYISGIIKAYHSGRLSSAVGVKGILKKVGYLCVIVCGITVDYIIVKGFSSVNLHIPFNFFFGLLVTIWLTINELISILENLSQIGVPVPKLLVKIIDKLQITVENYAENEENKNEK